MYPCTLVLYYTCTLLHLYLKVGREAIDQYLEKDDWHFWVNMKNGAVTMPLFQNLEAFWPGTLSMVGDIEAGLRSVHNYHQVWKQYGFTPEFYNVAQGKKQNLYLQKY